MRSSKLALAVLLLSGLAGAQQVNTPLFPGNFGCASRDSGAAPRVAYLPRAGQPRTPAEFARRIETDRAWMRRFPRLEGYGPVRALLRVPDHGAVLYLMGAPGSGSTARFLLVTLRPGAEPQVQAVRLRLLTEDPEAAPQPDLPADTVPAGPAVSFRLRRLDRERGLTLWQVTATRGRRHSLYWLGLEERGAAQALEVATDASPDSPCGLSRQPASAYAASLQRAPFRASLAVEPEVYTSRDDRYTDGSLGNASPRCPGRARVTWKAGSGFVIEDVSAGCARPELPHRVLVTADGRLARLAPALDSAPEARR